jgi:muramoyltetrapeptide carboxypeptidase
MKVTLERAALLRSLGHPCIARPPSLQPFRKDIMSGRHPKGKILLIEDVDENPHRVDAMLTHLRTSGLIQQAAGILVGEMTRTDERQDEGIGSRPWRDIVADRLGNLGIPLAIDFPFGHAKNMLTLPLGITARLDATAGTLTYLEPLCQA